MDDTALRIRTARLSDAPVLLKIYAPYVEKTAITFECTVPDIEEFAARMRATLRRYPYLVAERGGEIVGYAYAGPFGSRAAYDWAVEMSIYLREDQRHRGTGKRLYAALEAVLRAQNIQNLYACIGCPDGADDAHLTRNSAQFHAHLGYTPWSGWKSASARTRRSLRPCARSRSSARQSWKPFWTVHKAAGRFRSGNGPCFFYRFCSSSYAPSSICAASARVRDAAQSLPAGYTPQDVRLDTAAHAQSGI